MVKRMVQADSAHQIGLKPTLHTVLIVVESGDTRGLKKLAESFILRNV
jgi:hypothetical protein